MLIFMVMKWSCDHTTTVSLVMKWVGEASPDVGYTDFRPNGCNQLQSNIGRMYTYWSCTKISWPNHVAEYWWFKFSSRLFPSYSIQTNVISLTLKQFLANHGCTQLDCGKRNLQLIIKGGLSISIVMVTLANLSCLII